MEIEIFEENDSNKFLFKKLLLEHEAPSLAEKLLAVSICGICVSFFASVI